MNVEEAARQILNDPYNSLVFDAAHGIELYLVGGYTRNMLAGRTSRDRDYVFRGSVEGIVNQILPETQGRLIRLGREGLNRIVLRDGGTLDFTPLREDIQRDLALRDLTINSIAWSPSSGWIDPEGGMGDLERGLIKMVDPRNLTLDPLRLLRAYRFAAEFSFDIEPVTRSFLNKFSLLIRKTKSERITSEFFKILNLNNPANTIHESLADNLLPQLIRNTYGNLEPKVKALRNIYSLSSSTLLKYRIKEDEIFSQGLSHKGLLALEILLQGLPNHHFVLSSRILKRLSRLAKAEEFIGQQPLNELSRETIFEIFEAADDAVPDLLIIMGMSAHVFDLEEYRRIRRRALLTAEEVKSLLGAGPGPALGNALRSLRKAEFTGNITTAKDAALFLRTGRAL